MCIYLLFHWFSGKIVLSEAYRGVLYKKGKHLCQSLFFNKFAIV